MAVRLVGPSASGTVTHSFTELTPVCSIDMVLEFSHELPANLTVRWGTTLLEGSGEDGGGVGVGRKKSLKHRPVSFEGMTSATLPSPVGSGELVRIPLRAKVRRPGWVAVEQCWVRWSPSDGDVGDSDSDGGLGGHVVVPSAYFYVDSNVNE